ncbi:hypothetical protein [Vibrio sp. F74]|uniref:hypothetical protein n=1 Tax=Vibrio sp. F74 TaxID=700020 RepID=UPI0035F5C30C
MNAVDLEIAMLKWLIAVIACLYDQFFSNKLVPVLQGGQSFMKTTFISLVAD